MNRLVATLNDLPLFLREQTREQAYHTKITIEMRTYKIKSGLRARFLETFQSKSVPAHADIGMKISGPFLSVEDLTRSFFHAWLS